MSEYTVKLIELLKGNTTCNEIVELLGISHNQLFEELTNLKNKGFFYKRKYYYNGDIIYKQIRSNHELKDYLISSESDIITQHNLTDFRCMAISDLHLGSTFERLDLLDRVYNYCINKDIHIIFCCGDLIDGTFSKMIQKIPSIDEQIEYFIKNYPFDKNILTFVVGGDHDKSCLNKSFQDFREVINNYRHDVIMKDYANSFVNIKNDKIHLFHSTPGEILTNSEASIILSGHHHRYYSLFLKKGILQVFVPPLSNFGKPSALEMTFRFKKGYIVKVQIDDIVFEDKDVVLNSVTYKINKNKFVNISGINHEENFEKIDKIIKESSQIDENDVDIIKNGNEDLKQNQTEEFVRHGISQQEDIKKIKKLKHYSSVNYYLQK